MEFKLKTLTPIWTGGVEGKCDRLHETGIIGSLRWWYEALVRGLGGYACDPTSDERCQLNQEKFHKAIKRGKTVQEALDEQICPACQLFGCTGWGRKFRFHVDPLNQSYAPFVIAKPDGSQKPTFLGYYDKSGKEYEKNGGLIGEYRLTLLAQNDNQLNLIKLLLKLAANWGIGAGVQKGFGIVHIEDDIQFSNIKIPLSQNQTPMASYNLSLPRIDQFFFYKIPFDNAFITQIKDIIGRNIYKTVKDLREGKSLNNIFSDYAYVPTAPWVRRSIRRLFKHDVLRHFIMGFVKGSLKPLHLSCWRHSIVKDRKNENRYYCTECGEGNIKEKDILEKIGSKIFVSHIYNKNAFIEGKEPRWEMKIWGWIPDLPEKIEYERDDVKTTLKNNLNKEEFWKSCFNISSNPVIIDHIWEKWDINPQLLLEDGGEFYGQ